MQSILDSISREVIIIYKLTFVKVLVNQIYNSIGERKIWYSWGYVLHVLSLSTSSSYYTHTHTHTHTRTSFFSIIHSWVRAISIFTIFWSFLSSLLSLGENIYRGWGKEHQAAPLKLSTSGMTFPPLSVRCYNYWTPTIFPLRGADGEGR